MAAPDGARPGVRTRTMLDIAAEFLNRADNVSGVARARLDERSTGGAGMNSTPLEGLRDWVDPGRVLRGTSSS